MPPPPDIVRAFSGPVVIASTCLMLALPSPAASVKLKWEPNPEANVVRYQIRYATSTGSDARTIDAGANTRATLSGLLGGKTYHFTVTAIDDSGVSSEASDEIIYQTPASGDPTALVPRDGWRSHSADSEETDGYSVVRAFDGNPATFWHTRWRGGSTPPPHEIRIDLGAPHVVGGFSYLPRQDGLTVGNISGYGFFVSMNGTTWESPVATGSFTRTAEEKQVLFPPKYGRYVRLVGYSEVNGYQDCNAAELKILGYAACGGRPTAVDFTGSTPNETPVDLILRSQCSSYEPLAFRIRRFPLHGCVSGTPPHLVYSPEPGFTGSDSIVYQIYDGIADSNEASVLLTVAGSSAFDSWMASHGASGSLSGDADEDQIPNGIEFLFGADPSQPTDRDCLPTFQQSETDPGTFVFTYRRANAARSDPAMSCDVEWATHPSGPWMGAADTPEILSETIDNAAAPGVDKVRVSLPHSLSRKGSLFARLRLSNTTPK